MLADHGYDADWIRTIASKQGARANIPPKRDRKEPICFSPDLYRARNLVERFFNRARCHAIRQARCQLLAFVKLASIRLWLRAYKFTA